MTGRPGVVTAAVLALGAVLAGTAWWLSRELPEPDTGITLYGTVDVREVHLGFHEVEHVASILVEEGERVVAGQLLASQDDALLRAQAAAAAAEVEAQRAVVSRLVAGSRSEEVRKARADVEAAEAGLRDATATAARVERLVASGAVDRQRADDTRAAADAARARLAALRAALDLVVAGPRQQDIDEARARLARAEAELSLVRERLDDTRLRAPHDGIVRERILEPGDLASPERPVLVLALADPVWVRAYAPEPELGRLRDGMPAEVLTDSDPGTRHPGWVGFVSPTAEFTPKSVQTEALRTSLVYQVRVFACNPGGALRLGMPVTVRIPVEEAGSDASTPETRCATGARQ